MSKKDWYRVGISLSIVFYILCFILISWYYFSGMDYYHDRVREMKEVRSFSEKYGAKESPNNIYLIDNRVRSITILMILLNPFWIGIVIFTVLLKKTRKNTKEV